MEERNCRFLSGAGEDKVLGSGFNGAGEEGHEHQCYSDHSIVCLYCVPSDTNAGSISSTTKGYIWTFFFANIPHYNCINESQIIEMHDEQRGEEDL